MSEFKDVEGNCINPDQDTKDFILNHTMLRERSKKIIRFLYESDGNDLSA